MTTWPLYRALLRKTTRPILIGPWRGELGFEALYWIPWLKQQLQGVTAPIYVLTRGGAALWYGGVEHEIDLYDLRSPQDVRVENAVQHGKTGELKQRHVSKWDKAVMDDFAARLKVGKHYRLHPGWMFQALTPFWEGRQGLQDFAPSVDYHPLPRPSMIGDTVKLPPAFAAVRFYFRATFPPNPLSAQFAKSAIEQIAEKLLVVLLNSGIHADEHMDYAIKGRNILTLADCGITVSPQNNLAVLSSVLGKSSAFVGTYGGLAQLALRLGVPSVSFYSEWGGTMVAHKQISETIGMKLGVPFIVSKLTEAPLIKAVLPNLELRGPGSSHGSKPAAPYGSVPAPVPPAQ